MVVYLAGCVCLKCPSISTGEVVNPKKEGIKILVEKREGTGSRRVYHFCELHILSLS